MGDFARNQPLRKCMKESVSLCPFGTKYADAAKIHPLSTFHISYSGTQAYLKAAAAPGSKKYVQTLDGDGS